MLKIGVFGGSFNPPHTGHQRLALQAADRLALNKVLVMPASIPPHKQASALACAHDRIEMCRLAFSGDSRFEVSTLEIDRGDKSYTVDTLHEIRQQYPGAELYLIIGSDMLETFTKWYCWQEILDMAHICAASREKGYKFIPDEFTSEQQKKITFIESEPFEVSSSELRGKIQSDESTQGLLDEGVREYIEKNLLYCTSLAPYRELLTRHLNERRFYHSECVSRCARTLAAKYGADVNKAALAGLVHDIMKNVTEAGQRAVIDRAGIVLSEAESANPKVLHSIAGEAFLRTDCGIEDEEILSAVRYHTTGRAGMSLLDKVIYIADFISADRDYPDVDVVRRLADASLEQAILYTAGYTISKLVSKGKIIHPATVDCYNDTLLEIKRKGK